MSHEIILTGCSPTPLASYLKALGILRLVAAQDEDAKGLWCGDRFVLRSRFEEDELKNFLLNDYAPTPILAPWNGGSGFYFQEGKTKEKDPVTGKKIKTGVRDQATKATRAVETILAGSAKRFERYREILKLVKNKIRVFALTKAPADEHKDSFIQMLRNDLPDEVLEWMDAAVRLTDGDAKFPPLLGTGGNDGNLDFTNNYMQRLVELFDPATGKAAAEADAWLGNALYSNTTPGLVSDAAIGQFGPGWAGGANASSGFDAKSLVNPWDYVFLLEGALLFSAAATRRLESSVSVSLSYPFMVAPALGGNGAVTPRDETKKPGKKKPTSMGELWIPQWDRPCGIEELRQLFSEGRATLGGRFGGRAARNGLDFSRAVASLGVDRGITGFQRYAFLMRNGDSFLAVPLQKLRVERNPAADLIADLDKGGWLEELRRFVRSDETSNALKAQVRRLQDALFDLTQRREHPSTVQAVVIAIGEIQQSLAASTKARENVAPVPVLSERYVLAADDQSGEFRIACALAGLHGFEELPLPLRAHMAPVHPMNNGWMDAACKELQNDVLCRHRLHIWHHGRLVENLSNVMNRRLLLAQQLDFQDKPLAGYCGCELENVGAFLAGSVNDERIAALAAGLALCRMPETLPPREQNSTLLPAAYALLKALFTQDSVLRTLKVLSADKSLPIPPGLLRLLQADRVDAAIELAMRRLRASGVPAIFNARNMPSGRHLDGLRLAACLLIPLSFRATARLVRSVTEGEIEDPVVAATSV